MKRRLINKQHRCFSTEIISNVDFTSQVEPNLHDILVAYQHGEDVSEYVRLPAVKATAEQQFTNRVAKVDPLTEIPSYISKQVEKANAAVAKDRQSRSKKSEVKTDTQLSIETPPPPQE